MLTPLADAHCRLLSLIQQLSPAHTLTLGASDCQGIARHTSSNWLLMQVLDWVKRGWPQGPVDPEF